MSEELSEEDSRIMQRVQRPALEVLEDVLRKDRVLIQNPKVVVVLAGDGKGWAYLTEMLLRCLISQIRQVVFWKKTRKAGSYAYRKIKVILEEQERSMAEGKAERPQDGSKEPCSGDLVKT